MIIYKCGYFVTFRMHRDLQNKIDNLEFEYKQMKGINVNLRDKLNQLYAEYEHNNNTLCKRLQDEQYKSSQMKHTFQEERKQYAQDIRSLTDEKDNLLTRYLDAHNLTA